MTTFGSKNYSQVKQPVFFLDQLKSSAYSDGHSQLYSVQCNTTVQRTNIHLNMAKDVGE